MDGGQKGTHLVFDELFTTIHNIEVSFRISNPDITSLEPLIVGDRIPGRVRSVQIALLPTGSHQRISNLTRLRDGDEPSLH